MITKRDNQACWEYRHCPASFYTICEAYTYNLNCWEINEPTCCNKKNNPECLNCDVYENTHGHRLGK